MAETQTQQVIEARHSNVLPLPTATTYTTKDLQQRYKVSNKQVRNYASTVKDAYPWLESELKAGNKYTELMVHLIDEFKESGMSASQWVEYIHDENVDKLQVQKQEAATEIYDETTRQWLNSSALATFNQSKEITQSTPVYDYQDVSYLTIGQQSLTDSQTKLANTRTQSFDLSNRLLSQLSLLAQDKQMQEVAQQQEIAADIDSYAVQQAHIQLAKILKGEQLAREVDALYRRGVSPEEIGKMLNGLQSANFSGDVEQPNQSAKKS